MAVLNIHQKEVTQLYYGLIGVCNQTYFTGVNPEYSLLHAGVIIETHNQ